MSDGTAELLWAVVREDGNGNRYRVGRYTSRAEAENTIAELEGAGQGQVYFVEQLGRATT